jgi:hypothetical protein
VLDVANFAGEVKAGRSEVSSIALIGRGLIARERRFSSDVVRQSHPCRYSEEKEDQ